MHSFFRIRFVLLAAVAACLAVPVLADAAALYLSPSTGVYTAGATFRVDILLDTEGAAVNASEGTLSFNPGELKVVSISNAGSVFSLWAVEPEFNNATGVITYGGGSPKGYTGGAGRVVSVTFQALREAAARVTFTQGAALAADGQGTNVISAMRAGTYTLTAKSEIPKQEIVVPDNTPPAPDVRSTTHPERGGWYATTTAVLSWTFAKDVTEMRTLLDEKSSSIPTVHYRTPVTEKVIPDLPEGVSYFHLQARNANGWGKIAHVRIGVDTEKPTSFSMTQADAEDGGLPGIALLAADETSGIARYEFTIGDAAPVEWRASQGSVFPLPTLPPGRYTVVGKAFDYAGNYLVDSISVVIPSLDAPRFTEYPVTATPGTFIVAKGVAIPGGKVMVTVEHAGNVSSTTVSADDAGSFAYVAADPAESGVYHLTAQSFDKKGGQSELSERISIAVSQSAILRIGSLVLSVMSLVVPLIALVLALILLFLYGRHRLVVMRRRLRKEVSEAEAAVKKGFAELRKEAAHNIAQLEKVAARRALTKEEQDVLDNLKRHLDGIEAEVKKELDDVERLLKS